MCGGMLYRVDVLLGSAGPFGFLVGEWLFFPIDETRFSLILDKAEEFIFLTIESVLTSVSTSKNISDQHSS